jgi:hypothetical protein
MSSKHILEALSRANLSDEECRLAPLNVTGNNRVFKAESGGLTFLVKEYVQHPNDPRDRYQTERVFYSYLSEIGSRQTPKPLAWLEQERLACFEFISGSKPTVATRELIDAALDFLFSLNGQRDSASAQTIPAASEACFSMEEHVRCIDRRVARLDDIEPLTEFHQEAIRLAREQIQPAWAKIRQPLEADYSTPLLQSQRCLSPSDFGFHNAIVDESNLPRFFDFEYAGWDDPAKTVCDFFCQPSVPLPIEWLSHFTEAVAARFKSDRFAERVELLLPAYRIKWCCIMLNEFLPLGQHRRAFSNSNLDRTQQLRNQINKCNSAYRAWLSI